jgi:hypothetical protein
MVIAHAQLPAVERSDRQRGLSIDETSEEMRIVVVQRLDPFQPDPGEGAITAN